MISNISQDIATTSPTTLQQQDAPTKLQGNVLSSFYKNWKPIAAVSVLTATTLAAVYFASHELQGTTPTPKDPTNKIPKYYNDTLKCYLGVKSNSFTSKTYSGDTIPVLKTILPNVNGTKYLNETLSQLLFLEPISSPFVSQPEAASAASTVVQNNSNTTKTDFDALKSLMQDQKNMQAQIDSKVDRLLGMLSKEIV